MHNPFLRAFLSQLNIVQSFPPPCLIQYPFPRSLEQQSSSLHNRFPPWLWHKLFRWDTRGHPSIRQYLEARLRVPFEGEMARCILANSRGDSVDAFFSKYGECCDSMGDEVVDKESIEDGRPRNVQEDWVFGMPKETAGSMMDRSGGIFISRSYGCSLLHRERPFAILDRCNRLRIPSRDGNLTQFEVVALNGNGDKVRSCWYSAVNGSIVARSGFIKIEDFIEFESQICVVPSNIIDKSV